MARITIIRMAGCLAVLLAIAWYVVHAQESRQPVLGSAAVGQAQPPGPGAGGIKRTMYVVQHGSAKGLADAINKHYKGEAEVQAVADGPSNCLLISASPAVFGEVVKLLGQLDRRPQQIAVEVLVAEVPPQKGDVKKGPAEKDLDERELASLPDALARVEALRKKGLIGNFKRFQLTAIENQPISLTMGVTKPHVTGTSVDPRGGGLRGGAPAAASVSRMINYRDMGTIVNVTARVSGEKAIALDLNIEDNSMQVPEDGAQIGADEQGRPIRASEFVRTSLKTRLDIAPGQAVVAKDVMTASKSGQAQTLVIVTARIVGPGARESK